MKRSSRFDLAVLGAGPAGLSGAVAAAEGGCRVALIDEQSAPGGQVWRSGIRPRPPAARRLAARARNAGVVWIGGSTVLDLPDPHQIRAETPEGPRTIGSDALLIATGARERFLPFPGWTLPNVTGTAGLQALARGGFPVAGRRIVLAGSGPLLVAVAGQLLEEGADLAVVAEQARTASRWRLGLELLFRPRRWAEAAVHLARISGIRYLDDCWPIAALGRDRVEAVRLMRRGVVWEERCDLLGCGFGLVANLEPARLLGCRLDRAGGAVAVDLWQRTSVETVYAAGEVTGIGGLAAARIEGEIAGHHLAGRTERAARLLGARRRAASFARRLEELFAPREELRHLAGPDTVVCRCEDASWGAIEAALRMNPPAGAERSRPRGRNARGRLLRLQARCGMGACQGRVCGPALEFLLQAELRSSRPPLQPAAVEDWIGPILKAPASGERIRT